MGEYAEIDAELNALNEGFPEKLNVEDE